MKTSRLFKRAIQNNAVIDEERNGYASSLTQGHSTYDTSVREMIRSMSVQEVIS